MEQSNNVRFYGVLAIAFAAGVVAIVLWTHFKWPEAEAVIAISHAVMIAAFLAATVDGYLKERALKEISRDASTYLIGYGLPPEVQGRIRELMCTSLIRSGFEARYLLREDADGAITLDVEHSFFLENYSNRDEKYTSTLTLSAAEQGEVHEMACLTEDPGSNYSMSPVPRLRQGDSDIFRGKEITVRPRGAGKVYRVFVRYSMKPIDQTEVLAFRRMTSHVTLIASGKGYEFTSASIAETALTSDGRWEYRQLFMPGEHLRLNWKKSGSLSLPQNNH